MKIFLAMWPTPDQTGCMKGTRYKNVLQSFHNGTRFKKDFVPFFDRQKKLKRKKRR